MHTTLHHTPHPPRRSLNTHWRPPRGGLRTRTIKPQAPRFLLDVLWLVHETFLSRQCRPLSRSFNRNANADTPPSAGALPGVGITRYSRMQMGK